MKHLLFASLLAVLNCATAAAAPTANRVAGTRAPADRLAQLYLGDTPMATTYGRGVISAPADTATLNYTLSRQDYTYGYAETDSEPPVFSRADRDRLEAFLTEEQGIASSNITLDLNPYDIYVTIKIPDPDQASLLALDDAMGSFALSQDSPHFVTNSYNTCTVEDSAAIEDEARLQAIADSRARIDAMAGAVGAEVGSILSMIEVHGYAYSSSTCNVPEDGMGVPEVTIELGVMTSFELLP